MSKNPAKNVHTVRMTDFATKTAASITEAISRSGSLNHSDGKVNVHIHVGDIILIGFDEAIDAEEWGMRENNTEIIGAPTSNGKRRQKENVSSEQTDNKKTSRSVSFKKGALELNATEHAEPVKQSAATKKSTRKKMSK
ncbi:hypothetical protein [Zwartia vadi]|uniref:hypothetical protein n=1 Tax=Zwartia vadi TaxID=3058168 RepID=UPI0025B3B4A6|nr:hypothetical protein [Zwartia vadi]MDN3988802.1 hypothetical protein [Zwartia vadi]